MLNQQRCHDGIELHSGEQFERRVAVFVGVVDGGALLNQQRCHTRMAFLAAQRSGVEPSLLARSTAAPFSISSDATAAWPFGS